jgi:anaerobic magnesium-protoporphyrin IX monomethyl ester cyclase
MRLLLVNPPHPSIGSRIPDEHLPPLGLLSVGGPLVDASHDVRLIDAEFGPMSVPEIVRQIVHAGPDAVLIGHSGSTSGHPSACQIARAARRVLPRVPIVYGGVFPTFHWRDVLSDEPAIDFVVRGEGEETIVRLFHALRTGRSPATVAGIAYREGGVPRATAPAMPIENLDAYRVGWELVDLRRYSYWGNRRAVVAQFSRGCPHVCSYCGQRGFWKRWRHRDPETFAAELAGLHRDHGVEVINFADENPTTSRETWRAFLEAIIGQNVSLTLVGSARADDIVRDADILHLYKKAGFARFLIGMENTNEETLRRIRKGSTTAVDREAIRLLRQHDILSMATYAFGFAEETDRDCWRGLRQIVSYDPDQIQTLYATPHRWTAHYREAAGRRVIVTDRSKWDYKHQVLESKHLPAWRLFVWVKIIELVAQTRPRSIWRLLAHRDRSIRAAIRWYYKMGRRVWFHEVADFLFRDRRVKDGPALAELWGPPQDSKDDRSRSLVRLAYSGRLCANALDPPCNRPELGAT